jgi:hypothetical protein
MDVRFRSIDGEHKRLAVEDIRDASRRVEF